MKISRINFYLIKLKKYINCLKRATNSFQYINVSLLYTNHRHVSAAYVDVFSAARERIRSVATLNLATWVTETCRWWLYFIWLNIYLFHIKDFWHSSIFAGPLQHRYFVSFMYVFYKNLFFSGMIQTVPPYRIHRIVISNTVGN